MLILAQRNQTSSTLSSTLTPCESWVEVRRWPPNPRFGEFSTLCSVRELFNVFLLNRRQFNSRDRTQFVKSGLRPSGSWIRKIGAWQIITKFYVFCKFQCSITSSWKNRRYFRTNLKIHLEIEKENLKRHRLSLMLHLFVCKPFVLCYISSQMEVEQSYSVFVD